MNDQERDERIVKMDTNIDWLIKMVGNHLQHHSKLLFWGMGIVTALIITLAGTILSLISK